MATQAKGGPGARKRALSAAPPPSFEACVVTYFSQDRAFQRVFAETDIDGMKNVVREKLGLGPNTGIRLAQFAEGRRIDLEDDADFYAFQLGAQMKPEVQVEVSVIPPPTVQLASPSITSTSTNLERAPTNTQAGDSGPSNSAPDALAPSTKKKKKKKPAKKNEAAATSIINDKAVAVAEDAEGQNEEPTPADIAATASTSAAPKSKTESLAASSASVVVPPPTTANAEGPSKKPKSKALPKPAPQTDEEPQPTSEAPKQPGTTETSTVPTKPKKAKKAAATTASSAPSNPSTAALEPAPQATSTTSAVPATQILDDATNTIESVPGTPSNPVESEVPQPRPKKRGRKSGVAPTAETPGVESSKATDTAAVAETGGPPAKKRRKSKINNGEINDPVATTLPPPGPSQRKSSIALHIDKSATAPLNSVGSAADIMQRWAARTAETEQRSHASGSEAGAPNPVLSPPLPAQELGADAVDQSADVKSKSKKKKKKAKEQLGDTSVHAPQEKNSCLVCRAGSHQSHNCPLLSQHDAGTIGIIQERVKDLQAGDPNKGLEDVVSRLRTWLKDAKKEVEARNVFAPSVDPTAPEAKKSQKGLAFNPPGIESTPVPSRSSFPKKSKLSSVAVSHQSEGSSTDDEDILNSVMRNAPDSEAGSVEEDDGKSDEEMADPPPETATPARETTPPSLPSASITPQAALVALPPSSPPANALLHSQRMTQSNVRALLDELEDEEAGNAKDSDDEGSELARSTPSDVVRRRHRQSNRMDNEDSDVDSTVEVVLDSADEDVEMRDLGNSATAGIGQDGGDEAAPMRLSQILNSSQPNGEDDLVSDGEKEDDIEEYESDADAEERNSAPDGEASSPIESPLGSNDQPDDEPSEEQPGPESTQPNISLSQPAEAEDSAEGGAGYAAEPEAPPPKRRGRPPLSQAVKDERAAQKARIQAEKAAQNGESSAPKKRGRPPLSRSAKGDKSTEVGPEEIESEARPGDDDATGSGQAPGAPSPAGPVTRKRSLSRATSSQFKPMSSQASPSATADAPAPRPRGRPRLSEAVIAEREAEKERVRAEKAIQRLEKKTAKANAKAAKAKGPNANDPPTEDSVDKADSPSANMDSASQMPAELERDESQMEGISLPPWSVLKNPSTSSKRGSSQADEIEWSGTEAGEKEGNVSKGPSRSEVASSSPDGVGKKADVTAKPLFLPSSGIAPKSTPRFMLPPSSPLPGAANVLSLSQQTPLQRRKSISSASLPRFTDIRRNHNLKQQSRKEQNRLQLSSQSIKLNSSQDPKPNGASQEVVTVEDESSSDGNSSADEGNKTLSQSQRKRRSAFDYFSQSK